MRWRVRAAAAVLPAILVLSSCGQWAGTTTSVSEERVGLAGRLDGGSEGNGGRRQKGDGGHGAAKAGGVRPSGPGGGGRWSERSGRDPGTELGGGPSIRKPRPGPERIAVVIGIDDYPGDDDDLVAAAADARLVRRTLTRLGFDRMVVLINGDATRDAILWATDWLARRSRPGGVAAFFYAGHVRRAAGDPDHDGEDLDEAILAADDRLVYDGELAGALQGARGRLWLAYAACYAAGFNDAAGPRRVSSYASGEESLAYESAALGHSFMVEYLVRRAMRQDGLTTVEEAHDRATREMRGDVKRFRPLVDDRVAGDLDLAEAPPEGPSPPDDPGAQPCLVVFRCKG